MLFIKHNWLLLGRFVCLSQYTKHGFWPHKYTFSNLLPNFVPFIHYARLNPRSLSIFLTQQEFFQLPDSFIILGQNYPRFRYIALRRFGSINRRKLSRSLGKMVYCLHFMETGCRFQWKHFPKSFTRYPTT